MSDSISIINIEEDKDMVNDDLPASNSSGNIFNHLDTMQLSTNGPKIGLSRSMNAIISNENKSSPENQVKSLGATEYAAESGFNTSFNAEVTAESIEQDGTRSLGQLPSYDSFEFELHLREFREENEKLKSALEANNQVIRTQLNSIHAWKEELELQRQNNEQLKKDYDEAMFKAKKENEILKERTKELESFSTLKMNQEVETVETGVGTPKEVSLQNYEQLNVCEEIRSQDIIAKLVDTEQELNRKHTEILTLKVQLNEARKDVDSVPALKAQLQFYIEDFKEESKIKEEAINEVKVLKDKIAKLTNEKMELEEKLDLGQPTINITDEATGGDTGMDTSDTNEVSESNGHSRRDRRRHRHHRRQ